MEIETFDLVNQTPVLISPYPHILGTYHELPYMFVLQHLSAVAPVHLLNVVKFPTSWSAPAIDWAIPGLICIQAVFTAYIHFSSACFLSCLQYCSFALLFFMAMNSFSLQPWIESSEPFVSLLSWPMLIHVFWWFHLFFFFGWFGVNSLIILVFISSSFIMFIIFFLCTHTHLPLIWDCSSIPCHFLSICLLVYINLVTKLFQYFEAWTFHIKPWKIMCFFYAFLALSFKSMHKPKSILA